MLLMFYKWIEVHAKSLLTTTLYKKMNKTVPGLSPVYLICRSVVSICLKQTFKKLKCNNFEMQLSTKNNQRQF